jgi:ureidoglycolate lyase
MTAQQDPALPRVPVRPLTPDAFARFGDVLAHHGPARRTPYPGALQAVAASPRPALWVSRVTVAQALPLRIERMERHRHAAQSFVPLQAGRWLVLVAPNTPDRGPDPAGAVAFLVGPGVGVCYHPGTWHGSLAVLDAPAEFVVLMSDAGHTDDDEFRTISPALELHA